MKELKKLPKGWQWVKLGDVCHIVRGSSPRPKGDPRYYDGNIPRLMVADVTRDGMYVTPQIDFLTEEGANLSRPMKKGAVILVVSGSPGLPCILAIDACIHDGFVGFKKLDRNLIISEFLFFYLKYIHSVVDSQAAGAIFRNLTTDQVKKLEILVPPLPEQKRIATLLTKKLAEVERARTAVEAQLEAAQALSVVAYLREVFEGKNAQNWKKDKLGNQVTKIGSGITPLGGQSVYHLKMAIKKLIYSVNRLNLVNNFKLFCLMFIHQMVTFK